MNSFSIETLVMVGTIVLIALAIATIAAETLGKETFIGKNRNEPGDPPPPQPPPPPGGLIYENPDENGVPATVRCTVCGAILLDGEPAEKLVDGLKAHEGICK